MTESMVTWMVPVLPVLIEGIVVLCGGVYQLISGKESFLMREYVKKYNYEKKRKQFIKMCSVLDIVGGILIVSLPVLRCRGASVSEILLLSIPILAIMGAVRRIMLWRYTDNLENRSK